jgi:hypothetical protein
VDAVESVGSDALIDEGMSSKNAANKFFVFLINHLSMIECGAKVIAVAKSLQAQTRKKAERDQSLAQRWSEEGVAISFRCSGFSTDGGRFQDRHGPL